MRFRTWVLVAVALLGLTATARAYTSLQYGITGTGVDQGDLVIFLGNVRDAVNELVDDHATNRTNMTETETLIEELHDDHATSKVTVDQLETLIEELGADHATFKTVVDALKTATNKAAYQANNYYVATSPALAIDTNFDVKNTETTTFVAAGVYYTLTDNTSCDTGTTKTIAASQWGAFMVEAVNASTLTCTWAAADYASEALALAAAKALTPSVGAVIGFVTVNAHASGYTAGTDALTTGTGGNIATATNYKDLATNLIVQVSSSAPATLSATTSITSGPATLTAPKPASPAASLTNSTDLTLSK